MNIKFFRFVMLSTALCALPLLASAYPSSINVVPCPDVVGADTLKLGYESDGHTTPYSDGYSEYFYSQFGIGDKLEVGVDAYDFDGDSTKYFNAKYLIVPEGEKVPAIAVGTMFVGKDSKSAYYAVGCRTFGKYRFHLGAESQAGTHFGLFGADYTINDKLSLLADCATGTLGYRTLGICWEPRSDLSFTLYGLRYTNGSEDDYIGFCLGYSVQTR